MVLQVDIKKHGIWLLPVGLLLIWVYGAFDPAQSAYFPPCPFFTLTGLQCPGCGSQRAVHHLLNLEMGGALNQNPLLVLSLPYLLFGFWLEWRKKQNTQTETWKKKYFGKKAAWLALGLILIYWVGRNLPAGLFLS